MEFWLLLAKVGRSRETTSADKSDDDWIFPYPKETKWIDHQYYIFDRYKEEWHYDNSTHSDKYAF